MLPKRRARLNKIGLCGIYISANNRIIREATHIEAAGSGGPSCSAWMRLGGPPNFQLSKFMQRV